MISCASMWAVVLRHTRMWQRDPNFLLGSFYWPLLDILVWGFVGAWIQKSQATEFQNYESVALLGVLLWQCVGRGCNALLMSLSEELWSCNIVNLFSLPLRLTDWIGGIVLFTMIIMSIISLFSILVCMLFYDIPFWPFLWTFGLFFLPLFISGIWVGFIGLQVIIMLGKRSVELGYVVAWFLLPFSGAYYPIEVLPMWAQKVSAFLPMSYLFQGMRGYVMHQQDPTPYLIKGSILAITYAFCSITLFVYCFNRSKRNGLARLTD